jgi:hypothetical protein
VHDKTQSIYRSPVLLAIVCPTPGE